MVDVNQLGAVAMLQAEAQGLKSGLEILSSGGRITSFVAATPVDTLPMGEQTVPAANMTYPPQMISAICSQIEARLDEINNELMGMGVTGFASA